jgi:hypothetical protein
MFLLRAAKNLNLNSTQPRRTAWGVQRGIERCSMVIFSDTLGSPWPPLSQHQNTQYQLETSLKLSG